MYLTTLPVIQPLMLGTRGRRL